MPQNRSLPTDTILPHIHCRDIPASIAWLENAFGFTEHYRYGNPVSGAQIHLGNAWIMLKSAPPGQLTPAQLGYGTQSLTVFVDDVAAHYERAKSAGAKILEDPHETVYGEFQYAAEDLNGHHWLFSRHARDLSPADWGATIEHPAHIAPKISPMLAVPDGASAVEFYNAAFGATVLWQIAADSRAVAGLSVHGANLFLAEESPHYGTRSPASAGFTTVRIELFVDDPAAVHAQALAAGATERNPVTEYRYGTVGPNPIRRMLQSSVLDPFGHMWLIGRILE